MDGGVDGVATYSAGLIFEEFVSSVAPIILGHDVTSTDEVDDRGAELSGRLPDGTPVIIEAKLDTPTTRRRLEAAADHLEALAAHVRGGSEPRTVLAVPGVLAAEHEEYLRARSVELWDGPTLVRAGIQTGVEPPTGIGLVRGIQLVKPPGMQLRRHLRRIPIGKAGWQAYQEFCVDAFDYLFHPPLETPRVELSNTARVNRRDLVQANYATDGFWAFLRTHYRADFVVADAKNYNALVKKQEILQLANYLTHHGAGLFGLIVTRRGVNAGAAWTLREQWILHNKMIVVVTDDDMRQMLTAKDAGDDPSTTIRQKIEEFRLGL